MALRDRNHGVRKNDDSDDECAGQIRLIDLLWLPVCLHHHYVTNYTVILFILINLYIYLMCICEYTVIEPKGIKQ